MTFVSLSLGQLLYALTCQKPMRNRSLLSTLFANRNLDLALLASLALQALPFAFGRLGRVLGLGPIPRGDLAVALLAAAAPFLITETRHLIAERNQFEKDRSS